MPRIQVSFSTRDRRCGNWRWTLRKHNGLNVGAMNVAIAGVYAEKYDPSKSGYDKTKE
jgi:hypothetical protein